MAITGTRGLFVPGPMHEPLPYGLFSSVDWQAVGDPHWEAGVEFEDVECSSLTSTLPDCAGTPGFAKSPAGGPDFFMHDPFTVIGSYKCATGGRPANQAFDIARRRLMGNEEKGAEEIFWSGVTAAGTVAPSLSLGNVAAGATPVNLTPPGGPVGPVIALSLLESAMGDCLPGRGYVHMNRGLGEAFASQRLVNTDGQRAWTPMGNRYVFGSGYPDTGPGGVLPAAGTAWVFGTGPVWGVRGEVFMTPNDVGEAVDRVLNNVTVFAERVYAIGFTCCIFAINVDFSECLCGITS